MVAAYDPLPDNDEATNESEDQDASGKVRKVTSLADIKNLPIKTSPTTPENRREFEEQRFNELPFISGFLQVLRGPKKDVPIHYPRIPDPHLGCRPNPEGENFRWFVNNERGNKLALPAVTDEKGLPYQP